MSRHAAAKHSSSFPSQHASTSRIVCAAILTLVATLGCLVPLKSQEWGSSLDPATLDAALRELPPEAASAFLPLTRVFYERITSRRVNSRATFEDPSMRQFFPSVAAYSDYYAALVDAIDRANIENNRPTIVEFLSIEAESDGLVRLSLRFIGANDLPLRWWSASLSRDDEWQWRDGRWWVVPGKV